MGFKENLKIELEYSGMYVKQLASQSGVNKFSLDKYLCGKAIPNIETAVKIANTLGVSVEYLVTGKETSKKPVRSLKGTPLRIGQLAEQLDAEKQEFAFEFMRWLVGLKGK